MSIWSTPLGIAGIVFIIIGLIMALVGIILLVVDKDIAKPWYIWFLLAGGVIFGIAGGIMLAVEYSRMGKMTKKIKTYQNDCGEEYHETNAKTKMVYKKPQNTFIYTSDEEPVVYKQKKKCVKNIPCVGYSSSSLSDYPQKTKTIYVEKPASKPVTKTIYVEKSATKPATKTVVYSTPNSEPTKKIIYTNTPVNTPTNAIHLAPNTPLNTIHVENTSKGVLTELPKGVMKSKVISQLNPYHNQGDIIEHTHLNNSHVEWEEQTETIMNESNGIPVMDQNGRKGTYYPGTNVNKVVKAPMETKPAYLINRNTGQQILVD